jgi:hypothetical protein
MTKSPASRNLTFINNFKYLSEIAGRSVMLKAQLLRQLEIINW